jgi:hypothetical protein
MVNAEVGQSDHGWPVVSDADVGGSFDAVGVVAAAFDHARVGTMPAPGIEVGPAGDVGHDRRENAVLLFRGKRPSDRRLDGGPRAPSA